MPKLEALERLFFAATLAAIPIQLSFFFWPKQAFVLGIPIDLLAPVIYLSDFALVLYLAFFLSANRHLLARVLKDQKLLFYSLFIFSLYLAINSLFISDAPLASLIFTGRFFLLSIFVLAAQFTLRKKPLRNLALNILTISLIWQSALLIAQFLLQKSLGLYFLGERAHDTSTVGIAHWQFFGKELLRPYGTFPHPNVAAAFVIILSILLKWRLTGLIFTVLALIVTFSKAALIAFGAFFIIGAGTARNLLLRLAVVSALLFFLAKNIPVAQLAHLAERLTLAQAAIEIFRQNPLFGVGANRFISALAALDLFSASQVRLLQPVHNVFLLILAENGLVGLLAFILILASIARQIVTRGQLAIFIVLLIFASFDHFFWTLAQGRLLFWTAAAFIIADSAKGRNV